MQLSPNEAGHSLDISSLVQLDSRGGVQWFRLRAPLMGPQRQGVSCLRIVFSDALKNGLCSMGNITVRVIESRI